MTMGLYDKCQYDIGEHRGSVVECLTRDCGAAGLSLTVSLVLEQEIFLELVQPRKTFPNIAEKLLAGT